MVGHNAEVAQPALAGAICAERAAMLQALGQGPTRLQTLLQVVIVSDAASPITPGNLCREFMSEYGGPATPLLLASAAEPPPTAVGAAPPSVPVEIVAVTLGELYPHPPLLAKVPKAEVVAAAQALVAAAAAPFSPAAVEDDSTELWPAPPADCRMLYEQVLAAARSSVGSKFSDPNSVLQPLVPPLCIGIHPPFVACSMCCGH